jgi:hypothetical protein
MNEEGRMDSTSNGVSPSNAPSLRVDRISRRRCSCGRAWVVGGIVVVAIAARKKKRGSTRREGFESRGASSCWPSLPYSAAQPCCRYSHYAHLGIIACRSACRHTEPKITLSRPRLGRAARLLLLVNPPALRRRSPVCSHQRNRDGNHRILVIAWTPSSSSQPASINRLYVDSPAPPSSQFTFSAIHVSRCLAAHRHSIPTQVFEPLEPRVDSTSPIS